MDEVSDAEVRLFSINGQTFMLGGNLENIDMTNNFLNEVLLINNSKVDINDECNEQLYSNSSINSVKGVNDEPTKLEIGIQGNINELGTIQVGVDEAKALGLHFYEIKSEDVGSWENYDLNGVEEQTVTGDGKEVNDQLEKQILKVKQNSVPILSVNSVNREQKTLDIVNEKTKTSDSTHHALLLPKVDKSIKVFQESKTDNLPDAEHEEGFQIQTSEDWTLLPATVNAKMADGSYQTLTLIPQVVDGAVTYTVHFSDPENKNLNNLGSYKDSLESVSSKVEEFKNIENKDSKINEINTSVEEFLMSLRASTNYPIKNSLTGKKPGKTKVSISDIVNSSTEESILKINKSTNSTGDNTCINSVNRKKSPIETKIDNIISENESVISKCKNVKYGKKFKGGDGNALLQSIDKIAKDNFTKLKKVKLKNKEVRFLNGDLEEKHLNMSLLKSNKEIVNEKGAESNKTSNVKIHPRIKLNSRLEYPNLKALDETAPHLSYLKVKTSNTTKQPYFNVLPCPKDKSIPIQKQILPINCDLQQAKNLISLQKFLETKKLQLKVQPIVSNGNKIVNIKPKPTPVEDVKTTSLSSSELSTIESEKVSSSDLLEEDTQTTQENEYVNKSYQENLNLNNVLLSDEKLNCLKFLKSSNPDGPGETEKETPSSGKLNGIFIKNNPEYFSQKFKDGKADEHPLGSSENPIQLVQTGQTFHSRQPLSESQLRQIASILQKQKFDSSNVKKNSIFDPKTNTRIVYRVVYPEDVELKVADRNPAESITKKKRGRHKTKSLGEDEAHKKLPPLPRGPGRPKKETLSGLEDDIIEEEVDETTPKKKIPRTRSGRLSRPPRYMVKDYKHLNHFDISEKNSNSNYDSDEGFLAYQDQKKEPVQSNDNISELELERKFLTGLRPQQRSKRNFKPEYRCPTCQKIYLGHTRMMWHLNKFPDHCSVEKYKENYYRKRGEKKIRRATGRLNLYDRVKQILSTMSKDELMSLCGPILAEALTTWDFLLLRVNLLKASRKDEVDALLNELVLLLEKLTKMAEDIFLPVFIKEVEKEEDCVEISRMEIAIALGLPVGVYKVNNDNLNLLRLPLRSSQELKENEDSKKIKDFKVENGNDPFSAEAEEKQDLFNEKTDSWDEGKNSKKLEDDSFWLESKVEDSDGWHPPEEKPLSTKFEPNLSTKILESSNDSIDDSKYEEPVQLIDLDSNSKDIDQSNSSGNLDASPDINIVKEHQKISQMVGEKTQECRTKEKHSSELWNENSNLTSSEKVDETNSEFLDSLLSVPNSNEFLTTESSGFLSENIELINDKNEILKANQSGNNAKEKEEWRNDEGKNNYWETRKNPSWQKEENILPGNLQERIPGVRTANRLTSTPETNTNIPYSIPNRRNSISDFTNINLEPTNLDMVLPPAKTLIKDRLNDDENKFEMKTNVGEPFLEDSENFKVKNWETDNTKPNFSSANVNSEELMKMALESFTSQHDVINVPASSFDSAMVILNQNQETGNLNLFTSSETDGLDFNLPLPEHLLRSNFAPTNFQTTCASNFPSSESPAFLSTTNNIYGTTCTNSMKFDQFDSNYTNKKSKSLDDVMEFFDTKNSFNGFENCNANESSNINNFSFHSESRGEYSVAPPTVVETSPPKKQNKVRPKKTLKSGKVGKKVKVKKTVDYPKSNTIESIINEALFDSCAANSKSLQIENASPNGNSTISDRTENFSLPIIPESLDEVENLDFLKSGLI